MPKNKPRKTELPNYSTAPSLVIDLETFDPHIKELGPGWATGDGEVIGYGIGIPGHPEHSRYLSVRHNSYINTMEPEQAKCLMQALMNLPMPKIFQNAPYDMGWMKREGIKVEGPCYCTMEAAALIDERRSSYSLDSIGEWLVGRKKLTHKLEAFAGDRGWKASSDMYKMPPELVGEYCCGDVDLTGDVWLKERPLLDAQNLWDVFILESELLPLWVQMRWNGVRVDEEGIERTKQEFHEEAARIVRGLRDRYKVDVDLWKARSIEALCKQEGITHHRTRPSKGYPDGQPSFTKGWLENHPHEAMRQVALGRKFDKVATTFLEGLQRYCVKGVVHPEIHAMKSDDGGTVTGRLSLSNPGLHQMPGERSGMKMARAIRGLFICHDPRNFMGSFDYSQQEPRLQIHYASVLKLRGAEQAVQTFRDNPRTDYHQWSADTFAAPRKEAKIINLGLAYGMGILKLSYSLGCSFDEARERLDKYYSGMPWMRELQRTCTNKAADRGYIRTILGRRCRYEDWEPVDRELLKNSEAGVPLPREAALKEWPNTPLRRAFTYRGMNGLIQGSAADQTKKAMRDLYYDHGIVPTLQMHDELLCEVPHMEQGAVVTKTMEEAVKLAVPVVVDAAYGETWGDCLE